MNPASIRRSSSESHRAAESWIRAATPNAERLRQVSVSF
jgi:hypothetical protein